MIIDLILALVLGIGVGYMARAWRERDADAAIGRLMEAARQSADNLREAHLDQLKRGEELRAAGEEVEALQQAAWESLLEVRWKEVRWSLREAETPDELFGALTDARWGNLAEEMRGRLDTAWSWIDLETLGESLEEILHIQDLEGDPEWGTVWCLWVEASEGAREDLGMGDLPPEPSPGELRARFMEEIISQVEEEMAEEESWFERTKASLSRD